MKQKYRFASLFIREADALFMIVMMAAVLWTLIYNTEVHAGGTGMCWDVRVQGHRPCERNPIPNPNPELKPKQPRLDSARKEKRLRQQAEEQARLAVRRQKQALQALRREFIAAEIEDAVDPSRTRLNPRSKSPLGRVFGIETGGGTPEVLITQLALSGHRPGTGAVTQPSRVARENLLRAVSILNALEKKGTADCGENVNGTSCEDLRFLVGEMVFALRGEALKVRIPPFPYTQAAAERIDHLLEQVNVIEQRMFHLENIKGRRREIEVNLSHLEGTVSPQGAVRTIFQYFPVLTEELPPTTPAPPSESLETLRKEYAELVKKEEANNAALAKDQEVFHKNLKVVINLIP